MTTGYGQPTDTGERFNRRFVGLLPAIAMATIYALSLGVAFADDDDDEDERPWNVAQILIETTDNDIELQVFVDDSGWTEMEVSDPRGKRIFELEASRELGKQGFTEMGFASTPDHYPEDADPTGPQSAEAIAGFLAKFPAGEYEVEAETLGDVELVSRAVLTHDIPALPEITAPVSATDDLPVVDPDAAAIEWEEVTTQYFGGGSVDVTGYQVIVEQVDPFRKLVINLPASARSASIPPEFLEPDQLYDFELVVFEVSGNATISVGEFVTGP